MVEDTPQVDRRLQLQLKQQQVEGLVKEANQVVLEPPEYEPSICSSLLLPLLLNRHHTHTQVFTWLCGASATLKPLGFPLCSLLQLQLHLGAEEGKGLFLLLVVVLLLLPFQY